MSQTQRRIENGDASHSILLLPSDADTEVRNHRAHNDDAPVETEITRNVIALPTKNRLGTFSGVFVPTVIGTLGGVVLLRLSWIVGQAGVSHTLAMYGIIMVISWITDLSMSAIASNGEIKLGGTYYLISRSLGAEFGGSWGMIFLIANILGCAYYVLGVVEALFETFDLEDDYFLGVGIGTIVLFLFMLIILLGAKFFVRTSIVIFVCLMGSIFLVFISFLFPRRAVTGVTGPSLDTLALNWEPHYTQDSKNGYFDFRIMLGLLLPSVTGLMTGYNLSGDLARPGISLQSGNTWSTGITFAIYIALTLVFAWTVTPDTLTGNPYISQTICLVPWALDIGVFGAVSSSALATLIGASRTLQAVALDHLFPLGFFATSSFKGNEPRRAVLLCWICVQALIFIPSLDDLAPYIGMLYLLSYLIINIACFISVISGLPNFRPSFIYFHWSTALFGALISLGLMFYINVYIAALSLLVFMVLWIFVHFNAPNVEWGDIAQALIFHQVRKYLLVLDTSKISMQLWLPGVLLIVSSPSGKGIPNLIDTTNSLKKGGLFVVGSVLVGSWGQMIPTHKDLTHRWAVLVKTAKWKAFVDLIIDPCIRYGVQSLLLSTGVGALRPNTVVIGFHSEEYSDPTLSNLGHNLSDEVLDQIKEFPKLDIKFPDKEYVKVLKDINRAQKNLLVARNFEKIDKDEIKKRGKGKNNVPMTIDVWIVEEFVQRNCQNFEEFPHSYTGLYSNTSSLQIQLGHILHTANMWRTYTKLRIVSIVRSNVVEDEFIRLKEYLEKNNIVAKILALPMPEKCNPEAMSNILRANSSNSCVTFFPLPQFSKNVDYKTYVNDMDVLSRGLGPIYLVKPYV